MLKNNAYLLKNYVFLAKNHAFRQKNFSGQFQVPRKKIIFSTFDQQIESKRDQTRVAVKKRGFLKYRLFSGGQKPPLQIEIQKKKKKWKIHVINDFLGQKNVSFSNWKVFLSFLKKQLWGAWYTQIPIEKSSLTGNLSMEVPFFHRA